VSREDVRLGPSDETTGTTGRLLALERALPGTDVLVSAQGVREPRRIFSGVRHGGASSYRVRKARASEAAKRRALGSGYLERTAQAGCHSGTPSKGVPGARTRMAHGSGPIETMLFFMTFALLRVVRRPAGLAARVWRSQMEEHARWVSVPISCVVRNRRPAATVGKPLGTSR